MPPSVLQKNALHTAAMRGSTGRLSSLLSTGTLGIESADFEGWTALLFAVHNGHMRATKLLLKRGANVGAVTDDGYGVLHLAAQSGYVGLINILVSAGAGTGRKSSKGETPLIIALCNKKVAAMEALIDLGADPNCRMEDGETPLSIAAFKGILDAVRILLRAGADPLLRKSISDGKQFMTPLEVAAQWGQTEVVLDMVRQLGMEGCGGGKKALRLAAQLQHLETMSALMGLGVVDEGHALAAASGKGTEESVKCLLKAKEGERAKRAYINNAPPDYFGGTPLLSAIGFAGCPSPRIARMLVDAGADTTSVFPLKGESGEMDFNDTPLALATWYLRERKVGLHDATEDQLNKLEAVRRLLLRVEAAHAASWQWPSLVFANKSAKKTKKERTTMFPITTPSSQTPRVVLAALFRLVT